MGYEVLAFVSLEIAQGRLDDVCRHLIGIPEVLEVHTVTGPGDLHCRVVAHTNDHLQAVINRVLEAPGIDRTATQIALTEQLRHRVLPLVELAIDGAPVEGARPADGQASGANPWRSVFSVTTRGSRNWSR